MKIVCMFVFTPNGCQITHSVLDMAFVAVLWGVICWYFVTGCLVSPQLLPTDPPKKPDPITSETVVFWGLRLWQVIGIFAVFALAVGQYAFINTSLSSSNQTYIPQTPH